MTTFLAMSFSVLCIRKNLEIFYSVVQAVFVFVVNMLSAFKLSTNHFGHNLPMLVFPVSAFRCFDKPVEKATAVLKSFGSDWLFFKPSYSASPNHFLDFIFGPFNMRDNSFSGRYLPLHSSDLFFNRFRASFMAGLERRLIGASHAALQCHSGG